MFLIDSHCHLNQLDYKNLHKDVSDVLDKASQKGIQLVLSISTSVSDYNQMVCFVGDRDDVLFSCGVHPINLLSDIENFNQDQLYNLASNKKVIAIGETGLDYYRSTKEKNIQKRLFRDHIAVARNLNKPLIVHSRQSIQDTMCLLNEEHAEECGGILHCFNEDVNIARDLLNLNFYISFSGMITFSNSDILKEVIQYVPLDRVLLETDSPYLTPVPYRGYENQPAYLYEIALYLARIKNISIDRLAVSTTSNFYELFQMSR